jgi:phosphinothricin acetyltransferase
MAMELVIAAAQEQDLPAILALLNRAGLPQEGLRDHLATALIARQDDMIVGSAAIEHHSNAALLRSVAVDQTLRNQGVGQGLTRAALDLAHRRGVTTVYLLTETAGEFFVRFGFRPIDRSAVDPAVQQSIEFRSACPASAQAFVTTLATPAQLRTRPATPADAPRIAEIYNEGIVDRVATFETTLRSVEDVQAWFDGAHPIVVVEDDTGILAFASSSTYRPRACYAGIAEFSVYVTRATRGRGVGRLALSMLVREAERAGLWKLVSRVFVENTASRNLLRSLGFREVGIYEKHGQLDGVWRDVVIVEHLITANLTP